MVRYGLHQVDEQRSFGTGVSQRVRKDLEEGSHTGLHEAVSQTQALVCGLGPAGD